MTPLSEILQSSTPIVADSYALYGLATAHGPASGALREAVEEGRLTLTIPSVVLAVAHSMRCCGEEDCSQDHDPASPARLDTLCGLPGVEVATLDGPSAAKAGSLYGACVEANYHGAEILAACHATAVAHERRHRLLTTARARYCYVLADFHVLDGRKVIL
ncbi:hypothetical protein [Nonomuraea sp. NPDC049784]|uniref:hypothetical protein n=1 Tax=Nonomuraea sp. NPDC049784 TaxID=3154361 RepID=UPI0033CC2E90